MKEIKAYIRKVKVEEAVHALERAGVSDMTILDVMEVGGQADPQSLRLSIEIIEKYARVSKLEIVCSDERVAHIVKTLREAAFTGSPGDGIIYVTPVEQAIKIRTGGAEV
jgi:nitrogen regulatory protein P-II 1